MSQENTGPTTTNEPLPGSRAPFLYMQGDEPPGGGGGTSITNNPDDEVDAYGESLPPVDESITPTPEPSPDSTAASTTTSIGDEPPGGGGGVKTS